MERAKGSGCLTRSVKLAQLVRYCSSSAEAVTIAWSAAPLRACPSRSTWPITVRRGRFRRLLKYRSGPRCCRFWRWSRRERSADIRSDLGPASNAGQRQKRHNPSGARQTSRGRRRSLVTAPCGDAPRSLLALRPSASTRDPPQYFNGLQGKGNSERVRERGSSAKKGASNSAVKKAKPK
jgi:hypothetical protein